MSDFKVEDFFTVAADKKSAKCNLPNCNKEFNGCVKSNLKRHIASVHKLCFASKECGSATTKKITIAMDAEILIRACLKLVTISSLSFETFNAEGFRDIVDPIANALGVTINATVIKEKLSEAANKVKDTITDELHQKTFSLKVDSATRHGRSILGVNAQFIQNEKIVIRTLAMWEMKIRHTADNIKKEIVKILSVYKCSLRQVCSITIDNGANMVKCVSLLEDAQDDEISEVVNEGNVESVVDQDNAEESNLNEINDCIVNCTLRCVRCASHTLQVNNN